MTMTPQDSPPLGPSALPLSYAEIRQHLGVLPLLLLLSLFANVACPPPLPLHAVAGAPYLLTPAAKSSSIRIPEIKTIA